MGGTTHTVLKGRELSGRGYVQGKSLQLLTRLSDYTVWQRFRSHIQSAFSAERYDFPDETVRNGG